MATIIFDFDGTIADSFEYCVNFLAREAGTYPLGADQKAALRGLSLFRIARRLGVPWRKMPLLLSRGQRQMTAAVKHVEPFPDLERVIRELHAEKHDLYILSTNTQVNIQKFLKRHKLDSYFIEVYGGVGAFGKAPALRRLLREQHLQTRSAVYVSDEVRDVMAAKSIGMGVIAVTWGFAKTEDLKDSGPTGVAHAPEDILGILGKAPL
jgi:phosphoglycolate phosphatase-like HAD superfamily hydrolase